MFLADTTAAYCGRSRATRCHKSPVPAFLFNWKIILAPMRIIDYVVVHELCHLVHCDHSKEYWRLLALHLPDYTESKEWLRVNGGLLEV